LWRRPEQVEGPVETVQLDENRTGFLGATADDDGGDARRKAPAQIGTDPER